MVCCHVCLSVESKRWGSQVVLTPAGDSNADYMADMDLPPSSSDDGSDSVEEQQPQPASALTDNIDDACSDTAARSSSLPEQQHLDSPTESNTAIPPEPPATANAAVRLERSLSGNMDADQMRHAFETQMRKMQLREASRQPPKPA